MTIVSEQEFEQLIAEALDSLPGEHVRNIENVAIVMQDEPTEEQRIQLELGDHETLFGLYEGVPLAQRQGIQPSLPDKITLFRVPLCEFSRDLHELKEEIRHTIWHEIGHYYGLNHAQIADLE